MKTCSRCKQNKEDHEFRVDKRMICGLRSQCRKCEISYQRQHRKDNPDLYKERDRASKLKGNYNITSTEYNSLLVKQDGKCVICGAHYTKLNKGLVIDHNHNTNEIRGLLCSNCNCVLGLVYDNIDILKEMIKYLRDESWKLAS